MDSDLAAAIAWAESVLNQTGEHWQPLAVRSNLRTLIAAAASVPREPTSMRLFTAFRPLINEAIKTHDANQTNAPDAAQYEGVVFTDGSVAQRWLTTKRSTATWTSLDDMMAIHGHPEYGTRIVWHDAAPQPAAKEKT